MSKTPSLLSGIAAAGDKAPELRDAFPIKPETPVQGDSVVAAQDQLTQTIGREGFPFAKVGEPEITVDHATRTATLDHLTSATGAALPFAGSRNLKVHVDLGATGLARAAVTVYPVAGAPSTTYVAVNRQGKGNLTVPFAAATVSSVEVTVANGSTRMVQCGSGTALSCGGVGVDDGLVAQVRFQAVG